MKKIVLLTLLLCSLFASWSVASNKTVATLYGFIENKGQIFDQNNKPNREVNYLYNGNSFHVQLRHGGFSYEMIKPEYHGKRTMMSPDMSDASYLHADAQAPFHQLPDSITYTCHRVDISFLNANPDAEMIPTNPSDDYINFYNSITPEAGATFVHHYHRVLYKNVYHNIDVEFLTGEANEKFEYNFIVHPGGNPNDIHLKFDGANNTALTPGGRIRIETANGNLFERIPLSYQPGATQQKVNVHYLKVAKNEYAISVKNYDASKILIVDPLPWGTYYGGTGGDYGTSIITDSIGNIYMFGSSTSLTNIATSGAFQTTGTSSSSGMLIKFNSVGIRQWATYYGGNGNTYGYDLTIDELANLYIIGFTTGTTGLSTTGSYQPLFGGLWDAFIAKFNTNGARLWGTYFGKTSTTIGTSIKYLNGFLALTATSHSDSMATAGAYHTIRAGLDDAIIAKFNSLGAVIWSTYYGGANDESSSAIEIDQSNNIIVTGSTNSINGIATSGAYQNYNSGGYDDYIVKFDANGNILWGTFYGGSGMEINNYSSSDHGKGVSLTTDHSNNIIIVGMTESSSGIATTGSYQTNLIGPYDAFIAKFAPTGGIQWATYFGGDSIDQAQAVVADSVNNLFIVGVTNSHTSIATSGAYSTVFKGGYAGPYVFGDAFISKFTSGGNLAWATYYGDTGYDGMFDVCFDPLGNLVTTGNTLSTSGIISPYNYSFKNTLSYNPAYVAISGDAFITTFTSTGGFYPLLNDTIIGNQVICYGSIPASFIEQPPTAGVGSIKYKWIQSGTASNTGFTDATGKNDSVHYFPGTLPVGTWYFKRTAVSGGFYDTSNSITINVLPKPNVAYNSNNSSQCITGNNFLFTDNSSFSSGTFTRMWNFGSSANDTSYSVNPSKTYSSVGNYNVKLLITASNGCKDSMTKVIGVGAKPAAGFTLGNTAGCSNGPGFTVTDTSKVGSGALSRNWNFGSGVSDTSTLSVFNKKYLSAGNYSIRLVSSSYGCNDTAFKSVTVYPKPNPGFTTNNNTQCKNNNNFIYTDTSTISSGTITRQWKLSTGINDTASISPVSKTYATPNVYMVTLVSISNYNCRDSVIGLMVVKPNPVAAFGISNSSQCLKGNQFNFTDSSTVSSGPLIIKWNLGTGASDTSILSSVTKTYTLANNYAVKLIATSNQNCKDSVSKTINVNPNPVSAFGINNSSQCLTGNNFVFTDSTSVSSGTLSRLWNFGNGTNDTSTTINPLKNYSGTGSFSVKLLSITNYNCRDSVTKNITINPQPGASVTPTGTISICPGGIVNLNANTVASLNYQWLNNNNPVTGANASNYAAMSEGAYRAIVTNSYTCKDTSNTVNVLFNPKPNAGFTINNTIQCLKGNNFVLSDTSSFSSGTVTRQWNFGDSTTSANASVNKSYPAAGTYTVKLISTGSNNCRDTSTRTITVNPQPGAIVSPAGSTTFCSGGNVTLNANTAAGLMYQWLNNGTAISGANNPAYNTTTGGNYKVFVANTSGCVDTSSTVNVTVNPLPVVGNIIGATSAHIGDTITYSVTGNTGINYAWSSVNGIIQSGQGTNAVKVKWNSKGTGAIKVVESNTNSCMDSTSINVSVNYTGVEVPATGSFMIYPNPASDYIMISHFNHDLSGAQIKVSDMLGRVVLESNVTQATSTVQIPFNTLKSGVYIISVELNNEITRVKVVND